MLPGTALTTETKMIQLGFLPLQHKLKFNAGVVMYTFLKHESAEYPSNMFSENHSRYTN